MSFRPPDPGRSNATDTILTRIIQSHARDLCEEGAELYKGVWVRPELSKWPIHVASSRDFAVSPHVSEY